MGAEFDKFVKDVDAAFEEKVVQKFLQFHKAVTLDAFRKVSTPALEAKGFGSPIWSGQFRSGHNVSVEKPDLTPPLPNADFIDARWPDVPDGARVLPANPMAGAAQKLLALKAFGQSFIANGAPYSRKLEGGSSLQAPNGVYKVAAKEVIAKYRKAGGQFGIGGKV